LLQYISALLPARLPDDSVKASIKSIIKGKVHNNGASFNTVVMKRLGVNIFGFPVTDIEYTFASGYRCLGRRGGGLQSRFPKDGDGWLKWILAL
jgi:hypothetical protein